MRLSMQDKYEFVKAAGRAREANDLTGLIRWVNGIVDAVENLPEGRSDAPCPPYRESARSGLRIETSQFSPIMPVHVDGPWDLVGERPQYPVPGSEAQ